MYIIRLFQELVIAQYDFIPQEEGELGFKKNDIITVTDKPDANWWRGVLGSQKGEFPATYVTPYNPQT